MKLKTQTKEEIFELAEKVDINTQCLVAEFDNKKDYYFWERIEHIDVGCLEFIGGRYEHLTDDYIEIISFTDFSPNEDWTWKIIDKIDLTELMLAKLENRREIYRNKDD